VIHYPTQHAVARHCLSFARKLGASNAYVLYHWKHEMVAFPSCATATRPQTATRSLLQPPPPLDVEGIPPWEMSYVNEMEKSGDF